MANASQDTKEIYWWPEGGKLIFLGEKATPNFWDQRWQSEDWKKTITRARKGRYWSGILNRYLPDKSSRILEGGCGDGHLVAAMRHCKGYEIYNLGESRPVRLDKLIREIEKALGKKAVINRLPMQPGDVYQTYADVTKAKEDLGYEPRTELSTGLAEFVKWLRKSKS